jgi:histidine ammonia-lyase
MEFAFDTVSFVEQILVMEINSVTDHPLIIKKNPFISRGNFHGEYPAKAADYLAIGVAEIGNMSEQRIDCLLNPNSHKNNDLPEYLTSASLGLNSGLMIAQYTAASLASENKVHVHPASSDTIPTSNGWEDHVSMGGWLCCLKVSKSCQKRGENCCH